MTNIINQMIDPGQGKILIAQPFLNDGYFKRTVILLAEHNEYGSMGFIVNRPMNLKIKDVLPVFPDFKQPLFYGGPVAESQLFFIHKEGERIKDALPIGNGYYWGGDFQDVVELLKENALDSNAIKFFVGYSGWEPQQMETEIQEKAWFINHADYKNIMSEETVDTWANELKKLGTNYAVLANFPEEPGLN
ncbi:MAG: YqgE/AlgH family protein [Bacteroidia bacterium]